MRESEYYTEIQCRECLPETKAPYFNASNVIAYGDVIEMNRVKAKKDCWNLATACKTGKQIDTLFYM